MDRYTTLNALLHCCVFLIGAGIGSFLNVVIYRLPLGLSVNNPRRSFCPICKKQIPWYRNLPLITWVVQRGKCAECGCSIPFRYFFVELLTALLFYATFLQFNGPWFLMTSQWGPVVLAYWILLALLIAGTFIDIDHMILPHEITMGGAFVGMACAFWAPSIVEQEEHAMGLTISFLSAALGLGSIWTVIELGKLAFGRLKHEFKEPVAWSIHEPAEDQPPVFTVHIDGEDVVHQWEDIFMRDSDRLIITCNELTVNERTWTNVVVEVTMQVLRVKTDPKGKAEEIQWDGVKKLTGTTTSIIIPREAMGHGDMFFVAMIGAFTGWKGVAFTIFAGSILGTLFAMLPRLIGRSEWTAKIPFGPYLAGGAALWVFYGPEFVQWYLWKCNLAQ